MSTPYKPKEPIVRDLSDYIYRTEERTKAFNDAVASAIAPENGGADEMKEQGIANLDNYIQWVDELLRWVPRVNTTGDELLTRILVFYWVFDQPSLRGLQTEIQPQNSNTDLSWLSYWLVTFAREQGSFMNSPQSAAAVYSFYINDKYKPEAPEWAEPKTGWLSFNHWFAREWKDIDVARPLDGKDDDNIIVSVADSMYDGSWPVDNGDVVITIDAKSVQWPINKLLQTTGTTFTGGNFMHAFLGPTDYHRQHAPVTGEVIEVRNIQDQVYLQVAKKKGGGLRGDRGLTRDLAELQKREAKPGKQFFALDAPDDAGYQWCQTRGLIIIQTKKYGKVAVLPIGMAQVSSVVFTVQKGDHVEKGQNISYFQFGGSDVVVVFENRVKFDGDLRPGETKLNVRKQFATFT
ncbi:putative phosphatidylserine decarboxylase [Aspergillus steynii IBT 23096]|uniref:Putative phosphatidylserine decarboxylase n=1 Tax=Aspergillus steynii IBT 23096 TaxID=1392250 RepID=A0A2I2FZY2_9EURO|nr:putative phosphatidylserine decarboxylase [Aspergillus steynii IBT 23096]PLB46202.1 putative phosphatidylserine decarboxylase [Aspergillus steynii IBT 23096]